MKWRNVLTTAINRETISYLIVGLCTTIISLVSFAASVFFGAGTALSNTLSHILATLFAYLTNKVIVFRVSNWKPTHLFKEFVKFIGARVFTYIGETALLVLLVDFFGFHAMVMKMFTMSLVILGNYFLSKFMVFNK